MKLKCKYMIEFDMEEAPYIRALDEIKEVAPTELQRLLENKLETSVTVTEVSTVFEEANHGAD